MELDEIIEQYDDFMITGMSYNFELERKIDQAIRLLKSIKKDYEHF